MATKDSKQQPARAEHCPGCGGWISTYSGQGEGYECNGIATEPGLDVERLATAIRNVTPWKNGGLPWSEAIATEYARLPPTRPRFHFRPQQQGLESQPKRGPYMNEDGDWWVAVADVNSFKEARRMVLDCLYYDVPEDGTLIYRGKEKVRLCDAPAGDHIDSLGGLDPAMCDETCRRDELSYHFEENPKW